MQSFNSQLVDLVIIQLTNWRWAWRGMIVAGLVLPLLAMLALSAFAANQDLGYILTGNLVMSLLFSVTARVSGNFAYMRVNGMLDYFASMPVHRVALILASAFSFLLLALPTVIAIIALGGVMLNVPLAISPWIFLVVPLVSLCLCGLGALLGTLNRSPEEISTLTNLLNFVLLFFGPVMIPPERLHPVLQTLGYLSPATYAASALRHTLLAQPEPIPLAIDLIVLCLVMTGLLALSARRMAWRM